MIPHLKLITKQILSPSVLLKEDKKANQYVIIDHPQVNAAFALHGGHLIHFKVNKQQPLIWTSPIAIYNDQKAIRGGVPICWPWFGIASSDLGKNLPSHGFARISKWSIADINEQTTGVILTLILNANHETKKIWPFDFKLTLKATLTDRLKLELITENTGKIPFTYQGALHSYINISNVSNIKVMGLNQKSFNKLTDDFNTKKGNLLIEQAIDSIYEKAPDTIILKDLDFKRNININNTGNNAEVVWNPWIDGAQECVDMHDDGYQTMICIESAVLAPRGQLVEPSSRHIFSTKLLGTSLT